MDLSTFQLVDAINDMDMLRNLSDQQQQDTAYPQQQQQHQNNAYDQLHGDIDLLFQQNTTSTQSPHLSTFLYSKNAMSSPHYRQTPRQQQQNDCFDQEVYRTKETNDKTMTPQFTYHQQQKIAYGQNDVDFSPLSSPAILPQRDRSSSTARRSVQRYQDQLNNTTDGEFKNMSAIQICEQYEQLEHAKLLITQKLSELQKTQQHQYDEGYQRSLLSSSSDSSSKDSPTSSTKNGLTQQNTTMNNGHHISILQAMSRPSSPTQSPHMEPATPASLMNMKMNSSSSSKLQFSSSGRTQQVYNHKTFSTNQTFQAPMTSTPSDNNSKNTIMSPMMTPTTSASHQHAPLSPLALHPRKARHSLKEKPARFSKKQRREGSDSKNSSIHASPRALKPLLISPTLNPGLKPLPSSSVPAMSSSSSRNSAVHSVEDAERILATRSNYQNLMEGKGAALGIAFSTQIKSGLEVRRTAHKAAEQKRRDSLKEWFDRLRREVEDGYVKRQKTLMSQVIKAQELEKNNSKKKEPNEDELEETVDASAMKPLSKVLLLQYAYEYIASLKETLEERDKTIENLMHGDHSAGHEYDTRNDNDSTHVGMKRRQDDDEEEEEDDDEDEDDVEDMQESDNEIISGDL